MRLKPFVQILHLSHSFGLFSLFKDISLSINDGDLFAIVGENGTGKTTLLKLLGKLITPDQGELHFLSNLTIGFLPQEIMVRDPEIYVRSYIEEGSLSDLEQKMALALEKHLLEDWAVFHEQYENLGGYKRVPVEKVFTGLKLETYLLEMPFFSLSGVQKVRVALAKALIENPDLLLLDEPTNHLDSEMLQWLEDFLQSRQGATVIVSHDRKFMNKVCNHIVEIKDQKLACYGGNYDFYLAEQERLLEKKIRAYQFQQEEKASLKEKIKAFSFSKKKASLPSDRNIMAYDHRGGNFQKSEARRLDVLKSRLEEIEANLLPNPKPKGITGLKFVSTPLNSAVAVELEEVGKSFGSKILFSHFSRSLQKGDRVILTGLNGSGKTTLLKCIAGKIAVDEGMIRIAPTAKIGYLDQEVDQFPMEQTPLDYFAAHFNLSEETLRKELHKAALGKADLIDRPFGLLSVGQRKRLMLLVIILTKPNVLLLDEPTNHLDFLTIEALEKALLEFDGAILAVSHDSTFIKKMGGLEWNLSI